MSRDLFIVARDDAALFEYLTRHFAGCREVAVVLDRRSASDRRVRAGPARLERRRRARTRNHRVAADLQSLGFAVVTVD